MWTWDNQLFTFCDEFDNITGYGAASLGSVSNPLVSRKDNTAWVYDSSRRLWYDRSDATRTSKGYPGKPVPVSATVPAKISFSVSNPKWSRIAVRRLGRLRGSVGFGNARAVRTLFDLTRKRQSKRIVQLRRLNFDPNIFGFERNDLLGPKADRQALESSTALKALEAMEGLLEVKQAVQQLLELVVQNSNREDDEQPMLHVVLNRIFVGNPGTGKTTVAHLYAQILTEVGLLSKGEVVLKSSSDFIGSALGSSEANTRAILSQAEGCVLVIDKAYGLNPAGTGSAISVGGTQDPYKTAVIDTIVEQV